MVDLNYYNPLTQRIIAAAQEVHTLLGPGLPENVYQKALEYELQLREIPYEAQERMEVPYKEIIAGYFIPDLVCYECVIVELKAAEHINYDVLVQQNITYMVAADMEVSLTLNFGKESLEVKRYLIPSKFQ